MTYETAVISRALKPHLTIRHGLLGTVKTDRLIGDRKRTPTTISHFEGMVREAQYTCVASVDVNASGSRLDMAAKELAAACQSPKPRAHGSELYGPPEPRRPITSDLRQEPGALAAHAGICAGGSGVTCPPTAT